MKPTEERYNHLNEKVKFWKNEGWKIGHVLTNIRKLKELSDSELVLLSNNERLLEEKSKRTGYSHLDARVYFDDFKEGNDISVNFGMFYNLGPLAKALDKWVKVDSDNGRNRDYEDFKDISKKLFLRQMNEKEYNKLIKGDVKTPFYDDEKGAKYYLCKQKDDSFKVVKTMLLK